MTETNERLDAVFAHIEANRDDFVTRVMDYVRHPSISAHDIGIREVAALLVNHLEGLGFEAEAVATRNHPMVLGKRIVSPDKPTVLLYGHYDVQPPDPLELWESPPFEPTIRNGRIYARGIGDNKGQHFAQLLAIESHLAVHGELPCNVIFLLEGEEEIGSPHIAEFVREHADRLDADLVVTSDGPLHESGAPVVTFGVRGVAGFELRARTASRDVHSGNFGGVVPNPLWTLVHLLATMKSPEGEITIAGLTEPVIPATNSEREAVSRLPLDLDAVKADLGLTKLDEPRERGYYDRLMFHPTLTINGLHGGYAGPGMKTVLPCEAFVKCDIRLVEPLTPDYVFEKVAAHVAEHAPDVEFVPLNGMLPSKTPMDSPFVPHIRRAVLAARGVEPLMYPTVGGSLPDYVFTKILGKPAFVIPYANADEANHAPNENLEIVRFIDGIRTGAALLQELSA
ncbi:M20/M25/M40 family metallo-hydrolase [Aliihoeflea aestuarii]|jgi:acetylornithine deacetylase/succinyl-diaminopimelate desuccinylase-like protein|uniref:M20/M25/M40 family metallo-hydrolase n=1 Tax=Aliihoeflea aestuarii TaxID=453840 RepID=UPI002093F8FE|nr:M20/M25/M40 family metallo-hydrolase [Aliihoeflea aestuarii]MCO6391773.1 M20/M25/M40 family metallo-hydrolase [Aliihoeflea aestuarii]